MQKFKPIQKLLIFVYAVGILWFCHHFIFRPLILDWGASAEIQNKQLPGDRFTQGHHHTRAVLIHSNAEKIWPWIVQLGQDRAGFYSYQWLENLFRADMRNSYVIRENFQVSRSVGDTVWLANRHRYNGMGYQILAESTPYRSFVMVGGKDYARINNGDKAAGSWAIYLYPENEEYTWLIVRSSNGDLAWADSVMRYLFFEVPHFIMEQKMLKTIKNLVENPHYEPADVAAAQRNL